MNDGLNDGGRFLKVYSRRDSNPQFSDVTFCVEVRRLIH